MALAKIKVGQFEKSAYVEKIKADENNDQYISIISNDVSPVDVMYVDALRSSFYVQDLEQDPKLMNRLYELGCTPRRVYIMPCVKYAIVSEVVNGKLTTNYSSKGMDLYYVQVTERDYKEIFIPLVSQCERAGGDITSYDLQVHSTKQGDYYRLSYNFTMPPRSAWREDPNGEAKIREFLNTYESRIERTLAVHTSPATFWRQAQTRFPALLEGVASNGASLPPPMSRPQIQAQGQVINPALSQSKLIGTQGPVIDVPNVVPSQRAFTPMPNPAVHNPAVPNSGLGVRANVEVGPSDPNPYIRSNTTTGMGYSAQIDSSTDFEAVRPQGNSFVATTSVDDIKIDIHDKEDLMSTLR